MALYCFIIILCTASAWNSTGLSSQLLLLAAFLLLLRALVFLLLRIVLVLRIYDSRTYDGRHLLIQHLGLAKQQHLLKVGFDRVAQRMQQHNISACNCSIC